MKLILITRPTFFTEESSIITALFEEGLDCLHLRKPNSEAIYAERLLSLIPETYHKRIVTHDHFYLKEKFHLMGIHLNHRNPSPPANYKGHISCSCHSIEEVKRRKSACNYVFLSPIFDSISKEQYPSQFTYEELWMASKNKIIDHKVFAMGGINLAHIKEIKALGFGGAVILGDLWNRFNPLMQKDYKELVQHFHKLKDLAD